MSSSYYRPPLRGVIYQNGSIVGGVDLSTADEPFIDQFNLEYAQLGLRVEPQQVAHRQAGVPDGGTAVTSAGRCAS